MRMSRRGLLAVPLAAPLAAPALLPRSAMAQGEWPTRPVRIIVPFPPGQATDTVMRLVAERLSARWSNPVVVENRAGGAGAPAMEAGARAAPDGYTLTAGTSATLGINPSVLARVPYDVERDFVGISNLAMVPLMIVAHPSFAGRDIRAMAEMARARPGGLDIASAGPATSQHMSIELLQSRTGLQFNIVHYRGSGPGITDLVGGIVPLMMDSVASALPHIRGGRAVALAVTSPARVPQLPDTPTLAESISPGFASAGWAGLVAPAGTPPEIVNRISEGVREVLAAPAMIERMHSFGMIPDGGTPEQFWTFVRAEIVKWREVARAANVQL